MLKGIVLRREDLAGLINYEEIRKQQVEATNTFLSKEHTSKIEDEGFGKQQQDSSTFKDVSSMVKIGQKRTYQQMNAVEPSPKDVDEEIPKEEEGGDLKKKRGLDGKMMPVEQRQTEAE